jgi:hypothetical protein
MQNMFAGTPLKKPLSMPKASVRALLTTTLI